jgi:hypothetical protein
MHGGHGREATSPVPATANGNLGNQPLDARRGLAALRVSLPTRVTQNPEPHLPSLLPEIARPPFGTFSRKELHR